MKKTQLAIALGLVSSTMLVGCGDDRPEIVSETTPPATPIVPYSVTAIDGYLKNAQVWLDINGNYQLDKDEPSALSGEGGVANLNVAGVENPKQYPVVVQAIAGETIDIGDDVTAPENKVVKTSYMMSAPAGETDVTPLSTLVHLVLEQNVANAQPQGGELTDEEIEVLKAKAVSQVAEQLGIANDKVLGDFIKEDNSAVAFAAENVVAAQILPESPEEMSKVVEDVKSDDPDDMVTDSDFLATAEAATSEIKATIDNVGGEENVDFSDVDPVFSENADTSDSDGDGVPNHLDAFDDDKTEWVDSDHDGTGNNADPDDDEDGVDDTQDAFPLNPDEYLDSDGDFIGNNADPDDDNDGTLDTDDDLPFNPTETVDTDKDGTGNNADTDDDNDGTLDTEDAFPLDPDESVDTDGDLIGNNADTDDDNDGVLDTDDALPEDPTKAVADRVTTDSYSSPFMDELANDVVIADVDVETTVETLINGNVKTTKVATYSTESSADYGSYTEVDWLAADGSFSRITSYRYDYNQDGNTEFEGKFLDIGNRTASGETYWRYIDEADGSAEGVKNGDGRTFDNVDFSSRVHPAGLTGIDTIQEHTVGWSTSNNIVTTIVSYKEYDVSGFVLAETSTHVTSYASSSERGEENGRLISFTIARDWGGNGTINQKGGFTALSETAYTVNRDGPVWANPQDGITEEYADFNFTQNNWDNLTQYWYEYSLSVDAQGVRLESGKRYVLDQTKDTNDVEANIKLVTVEKPDGLLFHEWSSVKKGVSDTESNEAVTWTHHPLDGYDFTASNLDSGQAYRVNLKQPDGVWVTYSFDEWGSQSVTDLATQVENARSGGTEIAAIDNSVIPGLTRYAATLPNGSFQYDDAGNAVQWYAVTRDSRLTDGSPTLVPMTLTDHGIKQGWYVFSSAVDLILAAPINEQNTWPWFNAYYRQLLNTHAMDLTAGNFSWTTDIGQLFLDQTAAQARLDEINAIPVYAICKSENTGEVANGTDTYDDFVPAAGNCGYTQVDSSVLDGETLYYKESDTSYYSYQFNNGGTGTYTESGGFTAGFSWSVNSDGIIAITNGGDEEYFALIANEGNKYSVLGFYIWDEEGVHYTEIIGQEFTTDEPVLPNNTAEIIQLLKDAGTVYSLWANDFNQLFVETITVSGEQATMTAVDLVRPDNTLASLPLNYDVDVQLTSSGWAVPEGYSIDMTNGELKAYPGSDSTYSYTLSGSIVDLEGKAIATSTPDWNKFADTNATFAPGAKLAELTLTADTAMYYLWDANAWVMRNDEGHETDGANATSLDELISQSSVGETAPADTMTATSVAYEISVELVEGGVANFYTFDWDSDTATKIGQGTWERDAGLPADIIAYTITPDMINQFNATVPGVWPGDAEEQHRIFSVFEGMVRQGEFEPAGTVDDDGFTLYTQTAWDDVQSKASISCSFDFSAETWDQGRFLERVAAYQQCSGISLPTVTAESMKGTVTHKINSEGEDRTYYYHADGKLTYDKNGDLRPRTWTVETIDGFNVIQQKSADGMVNLDQMVLLSKEGDELTYAYYWTDAHESEIRVMTDATYTSTIDVCGTDDSAWDDEKDQPVLPYSKLVEYDAAVAKCSSSPLAFTLDNLTNGGSSATWIIGEVNSFNNTSSITEDERIRFNRDGTGAFIDAEDGEFSFNWTIRSDGVLSMDMTHPTYDANQEIWTLLEHDSANGYYSVKAFYQDFKEWTPTPAANQGEIWSFVMTLAD